MSLRTKLSFAALASFASFGLFACSTSTDDPAEKDDAEVEFEESEVRACSETYARQFFVTLDGRSCSEVVGLRGKWVASSLEEGAKDSVCTMTWEGEKYSRADMDALRAFVKQTDAMTAACGSSSSIGNAYLTPIPHLDVIAHIGANGCDVCGKVRRDGKIIVVLPPYRTGSKQFEVPLSDGTSRAFQIEAAEGARAVRVQLPELPAGVTYAASRVTVY
jgi:hypothetical protein